MLNNDNTMYMDFRGFQFEAYYVWISSRYYRGGVANC